MNDEDDIRRYRVVVNDEEQYSLWEGGRDIPAGWRPEGFTGTEPECVEHIERVWTDMRPLSLRARADQGTDERAERPLD